MALAHVASPALTLRAMAITIARHLPSPHSVAVLQRHLGASGCGLCPLRLLHLASIIYVTLTIVAHEGWHSPEGQWRTPLPVPLL